MSTEVDGRATGPIAVLLAVLVGLGLGRVLVRSFGLVVLTAVVGATVVAMTVGVLVLRVLLH